jgi:hypothetical protein
LVSLKKEGEKRMKSHCKYDGTNKGIVRDEEEYEKLKNGELDWRSHVKENMSQVTIPYSVFNRLMLLDKAVEEACKKEKEE